MKALWSARESLFTQHTQTLSHTLSIVRTRPRSAVRARSARSKCVMVVYGCSAAGGTPASSYKRHEQVDFRQKLTVPPHNLLFLYLSLYLHSLFLSLTLFLSSSLTHLCLSQTQTPDRPLHTLHPTHLKAMAVVLLLLRGNDAIQVAQLDNACILGRRLVVLRVTGVLRGT